MITDRPRRRLIVMMSRSWIPASTSLLPSPEIESRNSCDLRHQQASFPQSLQDHSSSDGWVLEEPLCHGTSFERIQNFGTPMEIPSSSSATTLTMHPDHHLHSDYPPMLLSRLSPDFLSLCSVRVQLMRETISACHLLQSVLPVCETLIWLKEVDNVTQHLPRQKAASLVDLMDRSPMKSTSQLP